MPGLYNPSGVDALTSDVSTLTSDVSTLTSDVSTLTSDVSTLTSDVSTLASDVSTLTTDVSTLTTDVSGVVSDVSEIDEAAVAGLAGTANSLAYRVHEIERHLHSGARWFQPAASPSGETNVADRIGSGSGAFRIDAGNNTWGDWVQILGSSDTPADVGKTYYDPHLMVVSAAERTAVYFIQFARGDSGAAGYAAGTYTELVLDTTSKAGGTIIPVQTGRAPAGSKLWARCMCPPENTAWLDFYLGIHEYEG